MKNKNIIIAAGAAVAGVAAYLYYKKKQKKNYSNFSFHNVFSWITRTQPKRILFVGDSITAASYSYPMVIKKKKPALVIDVLAKGGQTTAWMLQNLPSMLAPNKYDRVYIYGGVNDAWNTSVKLDTTINNIQRMVDMVRANGSEPYVILGIEPNGYMDYRKMPVTRWQSGKQDNIALIERYKQIQAAIPARVRSARFVPKFIVSGSSTSDGIHPSASAQDKMATKVMDTF